MADAKEDFSRRDLERQIAELRRDQKRIEDNIRRMEANQQRIFRDDPRRVSALNEEDNAEASARKGSRSRSRSSKREDKEDGEKTKDKDKEETKDKDKEETKDSKENGDKAEEAKDADKKPAERRVREARPGKADPRSRNLFGKMLGHLHSARNRLQTEKDSKAAELHQKAEKRIEEKIALSKVNIKEFRKDKFEQQKQEEAAKVLDIEKTIREKEMLLLQRRLERHYEKMMNFIRTQAEPTIFYLPKKHNKETERALEETKAAIKHKIASLKVQLQPGQEVDEEVAEIAARARAAAAVEAAAEKPQEAPAAEEGSAAAAAAASEEEREDSAKENGTKETREDPEEAKETAEEKEGQSEKTPKPESDKKQAPSDEEDEKSASGDEKAAGKRKSPDSDEDAKAKKQKAKSDKSEDSKESE